MKILTPPFFLRHLATRLLVAGRQLHAWSYRLPGLNRRSRLGAALWALLIFVSYQVGRVQGLPHQASFTTLTVAGPRVLPTATIQPSGGSAKLAAARLPGGPTGQLLPPGTLASAYTYANSYALGNCTYYVASRRRVPSNWGNARTWMGAAQAAGWSTGNAPAIGAIAWTPAGSLGHVAVVEDVNGNQVRISEMNYLGLGRIDSRWVAASAFQYIY